MPTREELEDIMNNKPYGYGRRVITQKLKKYRVRADFSFSPKEKISTTDDVMATSGGAACFPGDDLKNALEKKRELEEKYPEFWVDMKKYVDRISD